MRHRWLLLVLPLLIVIVVACQEAASDEAELLLQGPALVMAYTDT